MPQLSTSFKSVQEKNSEINFEVNSKTTSTGIPYLEIENENYFIQLYQVHSNYDSIAKCCIAFNALVNFKSLDITVCMPVKEFIDSNELFIGTKSTRGNKRAVLSDYNKVTQKNYERLAIPYDRYNEIISIIRASVAA